MMDQFFSLKSMCYTFSGGVSAIFFCFTKQPVIEFFHQFFMAQQMNVTMMMILLVLMQVAYAGLLMGLSVAVVENKIKD
jgi:hypothetical protein